VDDHEEQEADGLWSSNNSELGTSYISMTTTSRQPLHYNSAL